jgi:nucleotide-binding universal stress UspA family protein
VAEKVLRGTANPLLLVRAKQNAKSEGEAALRSIIVALDGSELAGSVLPLAAGLAKHLDLDVVLLRAYSIPYSLYSFGHGYYAVDIRQFMAQVTEDMRSYLERKADEVRTLGVKKVCCVLREGLGADEIIKAGRETPDSLIVMCSHGRSGARRWALGSVAETVVRHADNPVLIARPAVPENG